MVGLRDLPAVFMLVILGGLVGAYGLLLLGEVQTDMTADSAEYNATGDVITGIGNITDKFDTIGTIVAMVLILGILFGGFMVFGRMTGRF